MRSIEYQIDTDYPECHICGSTIPQGEKFQVIEFNSKISEIRGREEFGEIVELIAKIKLCRGCHKQNGRKKIMKKIIKIKDSLLV